MEQNHGKPSSSLIDTVDYSGVLQAGTPRDVLESLLREHDRAKGPSANGAGSDLQAQIAGLRSELAHALGAIRGLLTEGDSDLHEMQLTSLRRQISQLEGVLESNYQREIRVAEDRETALRSEMAQMRQDLRVALETLYRMPAEASTSTDGVELTKLQHQIAALESSLTRTVSEQQSSVLERENALRAELAIMRRDLLVTLEASYQLPTERLEVLDGQIESWRGQVEELQTVFLNMQEAQDTGALQHRAALQEEIRQLGQDLRAVIDGAIPESLLHEVIAQRERLAQIADRVDERASALDGEISGISHAVNEAASSLAADVQLLRSQLGEALEQLKARSGEQSDAALAPALETLRAQVTEVQNALLERDRSVTQRTEERSLEVVSAIELLRTDVEQSITGVSSRLDSIVSGVSEDAFRASLQKLSAEIGAVREEQQTVLANQVDAVRRDLAASQDILLETSVHVREAASRAPAVTPEDVERILHGALAEIRGEWSGTQESQYRQLISQLGEMQSEIDNLRTVVQAIEPFDPGAPSAVGDTLERVRRLVEGLVDREVVPQDSGSGAELDRLRAEFEALRADLQARADMAPESDAGSVAAEPAFALDDLVRVMAAQLDAARLEGERLAANRDTILRHELSQIRQEMQTAVQQLSAGALTGGETNPQVDLSDVRADLNAVKAALADLGDSEDGRIAAELSQLREEFRASLEGVRSAAAAPAAQEAVQVDFLGARVEELEAALRDSQDEQRAWLSERDSALALQVADLRSSIESSATFSSPSRDEADTALRVELTELRSAIARMHDVSAEGETVGESTIAHQLEDLRTEVLGILEGMRAAAPVQPVQPDGASGISDGLTSLAALLQQSSANQQRMMESQQATMQAAIDQMRNEVQTAISGLTRESLDTFEKRQSQLRMDQLEMERNLAKLRQELVATQADPGNKKKLWR